MRPDLSLERADRYRTLTLFLRSAIQEENWVEVEALFASRARTLSELEGQAISPEARSVLRESFELEHEIMASLATFKAQISAEMVTLRRGQQASRSYQRSA